MSVRERIASLIGPFILIAIGLILLLYNLNIITIDLWSLFWGLWPLLIIAAALAMLLVGGSVFFPLTLIGLSSGFLLSNLGIVDWNMWQILGQWWPLLIVAIGLDVILGPHLGYAATRTERLSRQIDGAKEAKIKVEGGVGRSAEMSYYPVQLP